MRREDRVMKRVLPLAGLWWSLGWASGAGAAVTDANFALKNTGDLVALCSAKPSEGSKELAALNFCHGFTQGVVSVTLDRDRDDKRPKSFCFPSPIPPRAATLGEFVKWAQASPDRASARPADSFVGFLSERFPCGK